MPYGSQNLIEACAMGKPVILGPHTFNFEAATRMAVAANAALQVEDVAGLANAAETLLRDVVLRQQMGEQAYAFSQAQRGATDRVMALVGSHLTA